MIESTANSNWLLRAATRNSPKARLFCFPYAGAGASAYYGWDKFLPADLELCAVQLPGRESLTGVSPISEASLLVEAVLPRIQALLDRPFAFFGHSMGALLAFEVCRALRRAALPLPTVCVVSGRVPPQQRPRTSLHGLATVDFVDGIRRLGGTPEELLLDADFMAHLLPILRADVAVTESYRYYDEQALAVPLVAYGGKSDATVRHEDVVAWRAQTSHSFRSSFFDGGHFFIRTASQAFLSALRADLVSHLTV